MTHLEGFWEQVREVWGYSFGGLNVSELLTALGIFLVFVMLRGVICQLILSRIKALASKTQTDYDDMVVDAITPPIRIIPLVLGFYIATATISFDSDVEVIVSNFSKSFIAFALFWAMYRATDPIGTILQGAGRFLTKEMIEWLSKAIKAAVVIIGGAAIFEIWGVAVGPLVAGLGLFGVAVALGAQDLFKNLIAGIFILGEKRFHSGDWILVDGIVEGTVESIGFRTTTVRRFDKAPVYVPNAALADHAVTNFSRMTFRRIKWAIGVRYDASADQLTAVRDGIEKFLTEDDRFVKPDETSSFVRIDGFGASSIDIQIYCFTRTTNWLTWLAIKEELLLAIKRIVEDAGTDFAYPSQSLYLEGISNSTPLPLVSDNSND